MAKTTETKADALKGIPKGAKILVLRTCAADGTAHSGFKWPASGPVECPDWDSAPECGKGLHGLPWGEGDWSLMSSADDALWQVIEIDPADGYVEIDKSKCKFRKGTVVYTGLRAEAVTRVLAGAVAFERNKNLAGKKNTSSGNYSTAASSGDGSTAASSGDGSTAASNGNYSKATCDGASGIAATIGHGGLVKAGKLGLLIATYWDDEAKRYRAVTAEVGESGIEADVFYKVEKGRFVKC